MDFLKSKIYKACGSDDLRPNMMHVYFKDGFCMATNAFILLKESLSKVHGLSDEDIAKLDGKFIHKNQFKYLEKCVNFEVKDDGIEVSLLYSMRIKVMYSTLDLVYPQVTEILDLAIKDSKSATEPVVTGLNYNTITTFLQSIKCVGEENNIIINPRSVERKPILITFGGYELEDRLGVIMPNLTKEND